MGNNNVQAALQMADNAARQVTSSYQEWTAFLSTAVSASDKMKENAEEKM